MNASTIEILAAVLFALAVVHTFSTRYFEHMAHTRPAHAGLWHLLGEVETVFGFWAVLLLVGMTLTRGWAEMTEYLETRQFAEPIFVFVIIVIAASRPVLQLASGIVARVGRALPFEPGATRYFLSLSLVPLLGSLITEVAAMTLAAFMLRDQLFSRGVSSRVKYATLGVLFVNISIGGTLTHFAAPPVLMVAGTWGWSTADMFAMLGWKAMVAVLVNAAAITLLFRRQVAAAVLATPGHEESARRRVPRAFVAIHVALLAAVVWANHQPVVLMGLFMGFLGLAEAYKRHHDRLIVREGLMVAFFLAGLVVLGGQQAWWLKALLARLDETAVFFGAAALTAIADNAALTYLGSLVETISEGFKYALVAGAVAGGGLTVIANAPNPAGFAILKGSFEDEAINPFLLFVAALPPTAVALLFFWAGGGTIRELLDVGEWMAWLGGLDRSFLFLLLLPLVVAAFGLWADRARSSAAERRTGERPEAVASTGARSLRERSGRHDRPPRTARDRAEGRPDRAPAPDSTGALSKGSMGSGRSRRGAPSRRAS
jgi:Na+/H+ antiporter NhaD/arsenite permease-like protein